MNKTEFNELDILKQLDYINNRLLTDSMRAISIDLDIHKNTIPSLFKRNGYELDKDTKQYIKSNELSITKTNAQTEIVANKYSLAKEDIFKIPTKTKKKIETKAFNVVMKLGLVDKIDDIAKSKGYSRNQIINFMCEVFVDNMK